LDELSILRLDEGEVDWVVENESQASSPGNFEESVWTKVLIKSAAQKIDFE